MFFVFYLDNYIYPVILIWFYAWINHLISSYLILSFIHFIH